MEEKERTEKMEKNPEGKLKVTTHFSEIVSFNRVWKKNPYNVLNLKFLNYCCLIISKNAWLSPIFFLDFCSSC